MRTLRERSAGNAAQASTSAATPCADKRVRSTSTLVTHLQWGLPNMPAKKITPPSPKSALCAKSMISSLEQAPVTSAAQMAAAACGPHMLPRNARCLSDEVHGALRSTRADAMQAIISSSRFRKLRQSVSFGSA